MVEQKVQLAPGQTPLDLQANTSVDFEQVNAMNKMVTKQDGSKVPYKEQILISYLESKLDGLNQSYINLSIIVAKVTQGIYNGKSIHS